MNPIEQKEEFFASEGFFLQEREDGTFAFFDEEHELVALGESAEEAFEALEVNLELRLRNATWAFLEAAVPEEGFQA